MSLDKAINSGKKHHKPYRKSKRFDKARRNHGGCQYCEGQGVQILLKRLIGIEYDNE